MKADERQQIQAISNLSESIHRECLNKTDSSETVITDAALAIFNIANALLLPKRPWWKVWREDT